MGKAPTKDNTNGAVPAEVLSGKTYWGLRTDGTWGLQTGTMPDSCCACNGTVIGTRWCDNGDGTVTDLTTCLVWLKKANYGGPYPWRSSNTTYPWMYMDAHLRASQLYDGYPGSDLTDGSVIGNWRLPTKTELEWLANGPEAVRSGTPQAFTGVQSAYYWSSTNHINVDMAYGVNMGTRLTSAKLKEEVLWVWPVRSG